MTHYVINYTHLKPEEKQARAKQDCIDFLGDSVKYTEIVGALSVGLKSGESREMVLTILATVIGIRGYPAEVMVDEAQALP